MVSLRKAVPSREQAAALIIVLAFVVLLTGLVVAYVSRTTSERPVAQSSFNQSKADQLAASAMDNIIGDLRQEIADGSTTTTINGVTIYTPKNATYMVPQRSPTPAAGISPALLNLIRRSVNADAVPSPGRPSRASAVNSTTDASANGRSVSLARWNSHYLVPKANTGDTKSDPITTGFSSPNYWAPDWVFVTSNGATVITAPSSSIIGRYAYAIYDEGGLLDINLVGLPSQSPSPVTYVGPTTSPVTALGRKGTIAFSDLTALPLTSSGSTPNPTTISKFVGWRNYVTLTVKATDTFPNLSPSPAPFLTYFLSLDTNPSPNRDFLTVNPVTNSPKNNRTDQAFITRSALIQLQSSIGPIPNLLQYLSTFSREQNSPTWTAASNPISQRFQLSNLSLLGSIPTGGTSPSPAPTGTQATNIKTYFGLQWSAAKNRWQYVGQTGTSLLSAIPTPSPGASPPPDFFQILNYAFPGHTIAQILSLGACVIDQYDADRVTTAIEYGPAATPQPVAWGMEDLAPAVPMGSVSPSPTPWPAPTPIPGYVVLNRPFRNVGELGYAYNPATSATINFYTSSSTDAALLDFFTYNSASPRAGTVNVNTRNAPVLAAILMGALPSESTTTGVSSTTANTVATSIAAATNTQPATSRMDIARLTAAVGITIGATEEAKETVARALSDTTQTRTWGLMIDVIAQSGRYKPGETDLRKFLVEGEQRYWVHVAIDRFTGQVIGKQIEVVNE